MGARLAGQVVSRSHVGFSLWPREVRSRSAQDAHEFISDLASRLRNRVQLTTDGYRPYLEAIESAFGTEIDYAMLVKLYGNDPEGERRYSPPVCIAAIPQP